MPRDGLSITRKFLLWYFRYPPFNPYVTVHCAIDAGPLLDYVARVNADGGPHVTLQHVVTAAVARAYREHPKVNASVVGATIVRHEHVGVVMPVDLVDDGGSADLGLAFVEAAETLSLRELAQRTRAEVHRERGTSGGPSWSRLANEVLDHVPTRVLHRALDAASRLARTAPVTRVIHRRFPVSVVVSNVGAAIAVPRGTMVRGGNLALPNRLVEIGSVLGVFRIQDEVIAVDGEPRVRPVMPFSYVFDHRLFDGVVAGRMLTRLTEILGDPQAAFGETGEPARPAGDARGRARP
ncbi:MAG: 2-oxo acid dehydrogenase subunit E2 [Sandaracinaceae bacterium]|nr:2-oxo acid dehydrogenase subunit E2 [Sandaracinaceae bacterium]